MTITGLLIGVQLFSTHFGDLNPGAERTLATPGVYIVAPNGITVGAYRNSLRRTAVQAGYTHHMGKMSLSVGAVTGYPNTKTGYAHEPASKWPAPYVALSYRFGGEIGARAMWSPQRTHPVAFALEFGGS